jgi:hypothetical protein
MIFGTLEEKMRALIWVASAMNPYVKYEGIIEDAIALLNEAREEGKREAEEE